MDVHGKAGKTEGAEEGEGEERGGEVRDTAVRIKEAGGLKKEKDEKGCGVDGND